MNFIRRFMRGCQRFPTQEGMYEFYEAVHAGMSTPPGTGADV